LKNDEQGHGVQWWNPNKWKLNCHQTKANCRQSFVV
jgi:hypothetical protein